MAGEHPDTDDEERETERHDLCRREATTAAERDSEAQTERHERQNDMRDGTT